MLLIVANVFCWGIAAKYRRFFIGSLMFPSQFKLWHCPILTASAWSCRIEIIMAWVCTLWNSGMWHCVICSEQSCSPHLWGHLSEHWYPPAKLKEAYPRSQSDCWFRFKDYIENLSIWGKGGGGRRFCLRFDWCICITLKFPCLKHII